MISSDPPDKRFGRSQAWWTNAWVLMSWLPTASQAGLGQASSHVSKVEGFPIGREGHRRPLLPGQQMPRNQADAVLEDLFF